jgi:hypothetical protein
MLLMPSPEVEEAKIRMLGGGRAIGSMPEEEPLCCKGAPGLEADVLRRKRGVKVVDWREADLGDGRWRWSWRWRRGDPYRRRSGLFYFY